MFLIFFDFRDKIIQKKKEERDKVLEQYNKDNKPTTEKPPTEAPQKTTVVEAKMSLTKALASRMKTELVLGEENSPRVSNFL